MVKKLNDLTGIVNDFVGHYTKAVDLIPAVKSYVPFDMPTLIASYRKDRHFNTDLTKLSRWDDVSGIEISTNRNTSHPSAQITGGVINLLGRNGITLASISECVCLLKTAAALMVLQELVKNAYNADKIEICTDPDTGTSVFGILDDCKEYFDFTDGFEKKDPEELIKDMENTSWEMAKILYAYDYKVKPCGPDSIDFLLSGYTHK